MDATRQRLLPGASHTRADRAVAYRAMLFAAELLLGVGAGAVLDAPYGHAEDRADLARVAAGQWKLIECRVSPEARWHGCAPAGSRTRRAPTSPKRGWCASIASTATPARACARYR